MLMECWRCDFTSTDENLSSCPECGAELHAGFLREFAEEEKVKGAAFLEQSNQLSAKDWANKAIVGVIFYAALHMILLSILTPVLRVLDLPWDTLPQDHLITYVAVVIGLSMTSAAVVTITLLHRVYLAQLGGAGICAVAGVITIGVRAYTGDVPFPWEWMAVPLTSAMTGFVFGLKGGVSLHVEQVRVEQQQTSHDPSIKPFRDEKAIPVQLPISRVIKGGAVANFILVVWTTFFAFVLSPKGENLFGVVVLLPVAFITSLLGGGIYTSAGSRRAFLPGVASGVVAYGLILFFDFSLENIQWIGLILCGVIGGIGGLIGRLFFPPYAIYRTPDIAKADPRPVGSTGPLTSRHPSESGPAR